MPRSLKKPSVSSRDDDYDQGSDCTFAQYNGLLDPLTSEDTKLNLELTVKSLEELYKDPTNRMRHQIQHVLEAGGKKIKKTCTSNGFDRQLSLRTESGEERSNGNSLCTEDCTAAQKSSLGLCGKEEEILASTSHKLEKVGFFSFLKASIPSPYNTAAKASDGFMYLLLIPPIYQPWHHTNPTGTVFYQDMLIAITSAFIQASLEKNQDALGHSARKSAEIVKSVVKQLRCKFFPSSGH